MEAAAAAALLSGIIRVNKSVVEQVCQDALQSSANKCFRIYSLRFLTAHEVVN